MAVGGDPLVAESLAARATTFWGTVALGCLLVAVIAVVAWPASARATTLERMSIEQLSRRATMVVEGTVASTAVERTPAGVRTAVRIKVRESLKGVRSALKTVYVPGGTLPDGSRVVVDAMASFRPGEACYVFADTFGWVIGGFQGKLDVAGGRVLGSGSTTAAMSRRIEAALRPARLPARPVSGARQAATEGARRADPTVAFIEGKVSDSVDHRFLSGVLVTATSDGGLVFTTTTNADGYYRLDSLPVFYYPGSAWRSYLVSFEKAGYESDRASIKVDPYWGTAYYAYLYPSTPPPGKPTITSITPGEASAGTKTYVTINGHDFGATRGRVEFSYGRYGDMWIAAGGVTSWTDTSIRCPVPVTTVNGYPASAGSGPVVVTNSAGEKSNGYDFSVTFGYGGSKWASAAATYYVNPSGEDGALRESLVDAGAAAWNAAGSGFRLTDGGATNVGAGRDHMNVVSWASGLPAAVAAQSSMYRDAADSISEVDVVLNAAYPWGSGAAGSGTQDIQSVVTHEMGHWLMLLDLYMPGDSSKVMYGFLGENEQRRSLTAGDLAGITWIYPDRPADAVGPVCAAKDATVRRGGTVKLYIMVHDVLSEKVTMKLQITTSRGVVKGTWSRGYGENYAGWWAMTYKCQLAKGTYRIIVTGKDLAGNSASRVGRATLKVK